MLYITEKKWYCHILQNEEELLSEQIKLRNMAAKRLGDDLEPNSLNEEMDDSYCNIYNVLVPNYG